MHTTADALPQDRELALTPAPCRQRDATARFTLQAKVGLVAGNRFAVAFFDPADEQKAVLYPCLVQEVRRDMA